MARSVDEAFETLLSWLTPTATESAVARRHRASICECIQSTFGLVSFFRTGSFGNGTSVSGYSDVDYFAVLPHTALIADSRISVVRLRMALDDRFPSTGVAIDWPAVRVPFGEKGAETTEVVVACHAGDTAGGVRIFDIPAADGGWMKSSPEAHHLYVRHVDDALGGELRPTIRLIKAWKFYCEAPFSSFYLELRAAEYASSMRTIASPHSLPGLLRHVFDHGLAKANDPLGISAPVSSCSSSRHKLDALKKLATGIRLAEAATSAAYQGNDSQAFALWDRFYNGHFPGYY